MSKAKLWRNYWPRFCHYGSRIFSASETFCFRQVNSLEQIEPFVHANLQTCVRDTRASHVAGLVGPPPARFVALYSAGEWSNIPDSRSGHRWNKRSQRCDCTSGRVQSKAARRRDRCQWRLCDSSSADGRQLHGNAVEAKRGFPTGQLPVSVCLRDQHSDHRQLHRAKSDKRRFLSRLYN